MRTGHSMRLQKNKTHRKCLHKQSAWEWVECDQSTRHGFVCQRKEITLQDQYLDSLPICLLLPRSHDKRRLASSSNRQSRTLLQQNGCSKIEEKYRRHDTGMTGCPPQEFYALMLLRAGGNCCARADVTSCPSKTRGSPHVKQENDSRNLSPFGTTRHNTTAPALDSTQSQVRSPHSADETVELPGKNCKKLHPILEKEFVSFALSRNHYSHATYLQGMSTNEEISTIYNIFRSTDHALPRKETRKNYMTEC